MQAGILAERCASCRNCLGIAIDGVQRSTRYPGGIALRFARVKRYREDKRPAEADTVQTLRAMLKG